MSASRPKDRSYHGRRASGRPAAQVAERVSPRFKRLPTHSTGEWSVNRFVPPGLSGLSISFVAVGLAPTDEIVTFSRNPSRGGSPRRAQKLGRRPACRAIMVTANIRLTPARSRLRRAPVHGPATGSATSWRTPRLRPVSPTAAPPVTASKHEDSDCCIRSVASHEADPAQFSDSPGSSDPLANQDLHSTRCPPRGTRIPTQPSGNHLPLLFGHHSRRRLTRASGRPIWAGARSAWPLL